MKRIINKAYIKIVFILCLGFISFSSAFATDPPVAVDDIAISNEDIQLPIDVLDNDTDPQGNIDPTSVQIVGSATHGSLNVNPFSGIVIYTPETNYNGPDSFIYEVCDTDGLCDQATVFITINPINDNLTAMDDVGTTQEDQAVTMDVLSNDDDPLDPLGNPNPASLNITSPPQNGSVSIDPITNFVTYTPVSGFYGIDFYEYEICDDGNPLPPTCDIATVTITISQESPTIVDDYVNIIEDTSTDMDILQNDNDPQNSFDLSTLIIISDPLHGNVSVNNTTGTLIYNPNPGYHGQDQLQYEICDMDGYCGQAYVYITIEAVNDPPIVNDDTDFTLENVAVTTNILANDDDPDDALGNIDPASVSIIAQPSNGILTINYLTGAVTYSPEAGFYGEDSYDYQVCDNGYPLPAICRQATVTITVDHQSPVANNDFGSGDEENEILVNILLNDTDPQGVIDPTTAEVLVDPINGTADLNEFVGIVSYTPYENFNGTDSLVYQVCDPDGYCSQGTVYFTVNPLNDPPLIVDDMDATTENVAITTDILANDSDINDPLGNIDPASVTIIEDPLNGSVDINVSTGQVTYLPNNGFTGFDQYTYQVCDDGNPLPPECGSGIVTINIIKETPTAVNDTTSTLEDTALEIDILANDIDLQNNIDPESISFVVPPENGTATYNSSTQLVTYIPGENYNGIDSFIYEVCDMMELCDQAMVVLTIDAVNDMPVTLADTNTTTENMMVTTMILANDTDPNDPLGNIDPSTVSVITQPLHGEVIVDPVSGAATYTPNTGYYGTDSYTYSVCDNGYPLPALCGDAIVTLTISHQSPTAVDDVILTNEDTPAEVNVLANDIDPQNNLDPASVVIYTEPLHGSALVNPSTGTIQYTPDLNFYGDDIMAYTVCDTDGYCDQGQITINVTSVNDAPVANVDIVETGENVAVTTNVLLNDSDIFDPLGAIDPTTVQIVSEPLHGTVVVDPIYGYILYQPDPGYLGNDTYTYSVCDNGIPAPVLCGDGIVQISIQTINHQPLTMADYGNASQGGTIALNILENDSDPDGNLDPSSLSIIKLPNSGAMVSIGEDGWITINYQYVPSFSGADTLTYQVCDVLGLCDINFIYLNVVENYAPVANADFGTTKQSGNITLDVLENDTDPDDNIDPSSLVVIHNPISGADFHIDNSWNLHVDYFSVPDFKNEDTLIYKICDQLGYCDSTTVVINVDYESDDPVQVPNGFSPNGDGVNDKFVIPGIENFPGNELVIYNRWGNKVYTASGYDNTWDGKPNNNASIGAPLAPGTYFYVLSLGNGTNTMTGNVYINH